MPYRVRFLKATHELELVGQQANVPDVPYLYVTPEGHGQLRIDGSRYCWGRDSVGCDFSTPEARSAYMKKINDACGEIVAIPAEGGPR